MKQLFLLAMAVCCSAITLGQLTKEHTFVSNGRSTESSLLESDILYHNFNPDLNEIYIHQNDYQLIKTIKPATIDGYVITQTLYPSQKLFNSDEKMEIIVIFKAPTGNNHIMLLCDEDGTILHNFGNRSYAWLIKTSPTSTQYKLMTSIMEYDHTTMAWKCTDDIYSLAGQPTGTNLPTESVQLATVYPNPSSTQITIQHQGIENKQGKLMIYDMNGRVVESRDFNTENGKVNIDVSRYTKGLYLYNINNTTGRFVVK